MRLISQALPKLAAAEYGTIQVNPIPPSTNRWENSSSMTEPRVAAVEGPSTWNNSRE
jgi:hypothetical protein